LPPSTKVIDEVHSAVDEKPGSNVLIPWECSELTSIAG